MAYYDQYAWIFAIATCFAFMTAFGIGANDVANAYASSVGSRALNIKQAVVLAGIFEFLGALFLGKGVTDTIRKGIAKQDCFRDAEQGAAILMYGMMCVGIATGIWLLIASALELPVSTTHSVVGGIVGMTLATGYTDEDGVCVIWYEEPDLPDDPLPGGITGIVISWFVSPILSGIVAALLFLLARGLVLRRENSFDKSFLFYPLMVFLTIFINSLFILFKGTSGTTWYNFSLGSAIGDDGEYLVWVVALAIGAAAGLLFFLFTQPLKRRIENNWSDEKGIDTAIYAEKEVDSKDLNKGVGLGWVRNQLNIDPHDVLGTNATAGNIHANAEKFDPKTEESFKYLQVFTAIVDSFSHGANDVANSIGPYATVFFIWQNGYVAEGKKSDVGFNIVWILALGGLGIVVGLALYGYKIISAIGVKLVKITPSRGFAIELGAALVIAYGTNLGLPLSTTHCQVGATIGVGLLEGPSQVNWWVALKAAIGWVITLIVVGSFAAAFFAQGAYAPQLETCELFEVGGAVFRDGSCYTREPRDEVTTVLGNRVNCDCENHEDVLDTDDFTIYATAADEALIDAIVDDEPTDAQQAAIDRAQATFDAACDADTDLFVEVV